MTGYLDTLPFGEANRPKLEWLAAHTREGDVEVISAVIHCGTLDLMEGVSEPDDATTDDLLKAAGNRDPPNGSELRRVILFRGAEKGEGDERR